MRIRPSHSKGVQRWSKEQCIHALSTCSLAIAPPEDSQGCEPQNSQVFRCCRVVNYNLRDLVLRVSERPTG